MKYTVVVLKEDDGRFSAIVPSLNHTASFGSSIDEALDMVREASELYIETAYSDGSALPDDNPVVEVDMSEYNEAFLYKIDVGEALTVA